MRRRAEWTVLGWVFGAGVILAGCYSQDRSASHRELIEQEVAYVKGQTRQSAADGGAEDWLAGYADEEQELTHSVPDAWLASVGQTIIFDGTRSTGYKGKPDVYVQVGACEIPVRGVNLRSVSSGTRVRITGKLRSIQLPGQPGAGVQGQMGASRDRTGYFVDGSQLVVLERPEEVRP